MNASKFSHFHKVDGSVQIETDGAIARLHCWWPFDLSAGDYISIENEFDLAEYSAAVRSAISGETSQVSGRVGGFLKINPLPDGFALEFSNSAQGFMAKSLLVHVDQRVEALLVS